MKKQKLIINKKRVKKELLDVWIKESIKEDGVIDLDLFQDKVHDYYKEPDLSLNRRFSMFDYLGELVNEGKLEVEYGKHIKNRVRYTVK